MHVCKLGPYKSLLFNVLMSTPALRGGARAPIPSASPTPPPVVRQCIWWHSHLTGIAFQSVPSDWALGFLPDCGNGALFPSSQGYFHLNDLFHLPGAPHHYPPYFLSACFRYCFMCYSFCRNHCL